MWKQMKHRFRAPPRFVVIKDVLWKAAGVQNAKVRAYERPGVWARLTAIIKTGPRKTAGNKRSRCVRFPPSFSAIGISGKVDVVSTNVPFLFVGHVDSTGKETARRLAANRCLPWKLSMKIVDVFARDIAAATARVGVVEALYVDDVRYTFAPRPIHRHRHWPCRIELTNEPFHRGDDLRATFRTLLAFFIA